MTLVDRAAVVSHAGVGVRSQLEVGVALVVAKKNIEPGMLRLDEVVFEQERLGFRAHHGRLQARHLGHHVGGAGAGNAFLEVSRYALLEIARLADVEQRALGVVVAVDARQTR